MKVLMAAMLDWLFGSNTEKAMLRRVRRLERKLARVTAKANCMPEGPDRQVVLQKIEICQGTIARLRATVVTLTQVMHTLDLGADVNRMAETLGHKVVQ